MDQTTLQEKLSAYADGELDATQAAEVEAAVQGDPVLQRQVALYKRLDRAAAELPVPKLDDDTGQALWALVADQAFPPDGAATDVVAQTDWSGKLPPAPTVGEDRWQSVWANIRAQTQTEDAPADKAPNALPVSALPKSTTTKFDLPLQADFTPVNQTAVSDGEPAPGSTAGAEHDHIVRPPATFWKTAGLIAVAAMVLLVATMGLAPGLFQPHTPQTPVAKDDIVEHEELADDYVMMVKHVPGLDEPVTVLVPTR